jgi:hypothetical protein
MSLAQQPRLTQMINANLIPRSFVQPGGVRLRFLLEPFGHLFKSPPVMRTRRLICRSLNGRSPYQPIRVSSRSTSQGWYATPLLWLRPTSPLPDIFHRLMLVYLFQYHRRFFDGSFNDSSAHHSLLGGSAEGLGLLAAWPELPIDCTFVPKISSTGTSAPTVKSACLR